MSRILALEWDDFELRYLLASNGKNRPRLIAAGSCLLGDFSGTKEAAQVEDEPEHADENEEDINRVELKPDISDIIKDALKEHKVSKTVTLLNIKRSNVEFLQLELPPVTDNELSAMVRNQAMLESPLITEETILDYYSTSDDPKLPRNILAAAIQETSLNQIQSSMVLAGLNSKRFCLRNFSIASIANKLIEKMPETAFVINCVNREVDILVLQSGQLSQMRNIRLAEDAHDERCHSQILRELKRMIMLSPKSSSENDELGNVFLFGETEEYADLKDLLENDLKQEIQFLDPFTRLKAADNLVPEDPGKYASLISLVMEESREEEPAIDFLNPKKPPKPPNKQKRYLTYAAAIIAVVGTGYFLYSETLGQMNSDIAIMKDKLNERKKSDKTIEAEKSMMASIKDWQKGEVNWLDELRDLSIRFPVAQDIVIQRMSLTSSKKGGGSISLDGLARSPSVVSLMEQNIRDEYHQIETRSVKEQLRDKEYSWLFGTKLLIRKRDKDQFISHIPEHLRPVPKEDKEKEKKRKRVKSQAVHR